MYKIFFRNQVSFLEGYRGGCELSHGGLSHNRWNNRRMVNPSCLRVKEFCVRDCHCIAKAFVYQILLVNSNILGMNCFKSKYIRKFLNIIKCSSSGLLI